MDHPSTSPSAWGDDSYQVLTAEANAALSSRRLEEARSLFEAAYRLVADEADAVLADRAYCNMVAVEIELSRSFDGMIPRLRDILVRHGDTENCRLAAYHLARIYDVRGEYRKALFYSRIALERSNELERIDWMASSRNQIGNALLAESHFDQAAVEYETALELVRKGDEALATTAEPASESGSPDTKDQVSKALILDSLGYCRFVQERFKEGFTATFSSLRLLRRLGIRRLEALPHVTLAFGYLESERLRAAARHGLKAMALAEEFGDEESLKRSLFLMGEVYTAAGDGEAAYDYFARMQERYYPEQNFLANFLLAVDVRQLVNLKG